MTILVATIAPANENWRPNPQDSFPLSYYPKFSAKRGESYTVHYFVGIDADGNRHTISHKMAGTSGFNSTRRQINKMLCENKGPYCVAPSRRKWRPRKILPMLASSPSKL